MPFSFFAFLGEQMAFEGLGEPDFAAPGYLKGFLRPGMGFHFRHLWKIWLAKVA